MKYSSRKLSRIARLSAIPMLFLLSTTLLAIEPAPVWQTKSEIQCLAPEQIGTVSVTDTLLNEPYPCSVLGPRIDWG